MELGGPAPLASLFEPLFGLTPNRLPEIVPTAPNFVRLAQGSILPSIRLPIGTTNYL